MTVWFPQLATCSFDMTWTHAKLADARSAKTRHSWNEIWYKVTNRSTLIITNAYHISFVGFISEQKNFISYDLLSKSYLYIMYIDLSLFNWYIFYLFSDLSFKMTGPDLDSGGSTARCIQSVNSKSCSRNQIQKLSRSISESSIKVPRILFVCCIFFTLLNYIQAGMQNSFNGEKTIEHLFKQ